MSQLSNVSQEMKIRCEAFLVCVALTMPIAAKSAEEQQSATQANRELAWVGKWSPVESQGFQITKEFELSFSADFPLSYLRGTHIELHLQEEDGFIGAEATVEQRRLMFLIFADDEDPSKAWLVISRIDKIEGKRTVKILLKAYFRRSPHGTDSPPNED